VLLGAFNNNRVLWLLLLLAALLTAFYMTRLVFLTFFGPRRWVEGGHGAGHGAAAEHTDDDGDHADADAAAGLPHRHPHESPWTMWLPLVVLAGLAAVAGVLNLPFSSDLKFLEHWLYPSLFGNEVHVTVSSGGKWILGIVAIVGAFLGVIVARVRYGDRRADEFLEESPLLARGWGYDGAVSAFMGGPGRALFNGFSRFDGSVVDGVVNVVPRLIHRLGGVLRRAQSGLVRSYAVGILAGAVALLAYFASRTTF